MRCLGENVEERILIEDGETVVNDMDINSAFRSAEQSRFEALSPRIRTPDIGLKKNVVFRRGNRLEHVLVQGCSLCIRANFSSLDLSVKRRESREATCDVRDSFFAELIDDMNPDKRRRLSTEHS